MTASVFNVKFRRRTPRELWTEVTVSFTGLPPLPAIERNNLVIQAGWHRETGLSSLIMQQHCQDEGFFYFKKGRVIDIMDELFKHNDFFRILFDAIPVMAIIVDEEGRVHAINNATKNLLDVAYRDIYLQRGGEVFRCIHSHDDPEGCGFGPWCQNCMVRRTAMEAISGESVNRTKGKLDIQLNGEVKTINLLISSAPVNYHERNLAVVIIEDISNITELQGLLPICLNCRSIRDSKGDWKRLENFIEENSEADLSHGFCPDCMKKLYPDLKKAPDDK